jgi:peptide deformylase
MLDTMYDVGGMGLSACQVGVLKRIFVVDNLEEQALILINPRIIAQSGEITDNEGCLSVPGKHGTVTRPAYVKVMAYDEEMKPFEIEATQMLARAMCHEIDHLDGRIYVDLVEGELHDNYDLAEDDPY